MGIISRGGVVTTSFGVATEGLPHIEQHSLAEGPEWEKQARF